jgi:hypothetical protein
MAPDEFGVFTAKVAAQYGIARVALDHVWFDETSDATRMADPDNVVRLLGIFRVGKCDRLEPDHYMSAVISDGLLHQVLERANLPVESLRSAEPPFLPLQGEERLVGVDGLHRYKAAVQYFSEFPPEDRWWVVKLYDERGECDAVACPAPYPLHRCVRTDSCRNSTHRNRTEEHGLFLQQCEALPVR